ncbi:MAG TPA: hypothetical protein VF557_19625 [Jatrophihabitans sp.]|jgi:hypothetical protein
MNPDKALSGRLPIMERGCRLDAWFGGESVAEELLALADVLGQGVAAVEPFVGHQSAAGNEVDDAVSGSKPSRPHAAAR